MGFANAGIPMIRTVDYSRCGPIVEPRSLGKLSHRLVEDLTETVGSVNVFGVKELRLGV